MNINEKILKLLEKGANKAYKRGEIPVSAVVVDKYGKVISFAYNNRQKSCNVLGHAEILAIVKAEKKIKDWRLNGYSMYVTLEPCDMCSKVIEESRLDNVYYFIKKKDHKEENNTKYGKYLVNNHDKYTEIYKNMLKEFFNNMR